MLSPAQRRLLDASKELLLAQEAAGRRAPCLGLYLDATGVVREQRGEWTDGREEELFARMIQQLGDCVAQGATATALVVALQRRAGDSEGGAVLDLQEPGRRLVGVLPWTLAGAGLTFGEPSFTPMPSMLFDGD